MKNNKKIKKKLYSQNFMCKKIKNYKNKSLLCFFGFNYK